MCWLNTTYGGCEAGIRMSTPMTTPLIVYSPVPFSNKERRPGKRLYVRTVKHVS